MNFIKRAFSPVQQMLAAVAIFAMVLSLVYGAFPTQSVSATPQDTISYCHAPSGDGDKAQKHMDEPTASWNGHDGHDGDFLILTQEDEDRCDALVEGDDEGDDEDCDDDESDDCDDEGDDEGDDEDCDDDESDDCDDEGDDEGDDDCDENEGDLERNGQQYQGDGCDNNDDTDGEITIVAHKIVCTDEADLPNWGSAGGPNITSSTAADWVAGHESCDLVSGWDFEWVANNETTDPGDTLIGVAGGDWRTFGSTDTNGKTETTITESTLNGESKIWLREVLKAGYIPFTHEANPDNSNAVSAEFYCNNDVINYDNYEWIDGIQFGHNNYGQDARHMDTPDTYHCVAWNVLKETPKLCTVTLVSDTNTTVVEKANANAKLLSWLHPAWTAVISGASWIWGDDPVAPPVNDVTQNFERKFGWNGPVTSAKLTIAADNTFVAKLNGDAVGSDLTEYNYVAPAKEYNVSALIDQGNNELSVAVYNMIHSTDPKANPAGLLYKLEVTGTNPECDVPYEEEEILGCMDEEATNYDPKATVDDDSCIYTEIPVCQTNLNLLSNGSFEAEKVTDGSLWQKFSSVTGWAVAKVSDATGATLEHHLGWSGNVAADQSQYVELDGDEPTRILQNVPTVAGAKYKLSWAFAPRQDTVAAENNLGIEVEGTQVDTEGPTAGVGTLALEDWVAGDYEFIAGDASTEIAFKDLGPEAEGSAQDVGTFLDNACLLKIAEPILGCTDDAYDNYDPKATKDDGSCANDEVSVCEIGQNLLTNGGFETPDVTNAAQWDIFPSGTPTLGWTVTWAGAFVGAPVIANMELQHGVNGWLPSEGAQYAELDSDWVGPTSVPAGQEAASTRIAQTVTTVPGNVYGLSFDYSARPRTGTGDNMLEVIVDGDVKGTIGANGSANSNTVWQNLGYAFEADSASTEIAFRDAGIPNAEGTLLDNAVLCLLEENHHDNLIEGYKWNDADGDGYWDDSETEPGLAGWTIQVTNNEEIYSTTTNADGYYSFMVPDGSWTVTEVNQGGWEQTAPEGESCYYQFGKPIYARTQSVDDTADDSSYDPECNFGNHQVEVAPALACSLTASANPVYRGNNFDLIWNTDDADAVTLSGFGAVALDGTQSTSIQSGTTYTLTATKGAGDSLESVNCSVTVDIRSSGGGGGGGKKVKHSNDGEVEGDSTSKGPDGEVLGDSTSIMPLGAANTGAGGTSDSTTLPLALALIGIIASLALIRATKNG